MKDLSKKICLLRILNNYTQVHVAEKIGVSTTVYIGIEKDASSISIKRLHCIITFYEMTMEEFFSFSEGDMADILRGKAPALLKREFCPQLIDMLEGIRKLLLVQVKNSFMLIQNQNGQREN